MGDNLKSEQSAEYVWAEYWVECPLCEWKSLTLPGDALIQRYQLGAWYDKHYQDAHKPAPTIRMRRIDGQEGA